MSKGNVIITGVSTGIGYGACRSFIQRGYRVFGSVRKEEDAQRLSKEFGADYIPLLFDVTDYEAVERASDVVSKHLNGESIDVLVNNSGIAIGGILQYQEMEEIERHFKVNVFGLMKVTKVFLPLLGAVDGFEGKPGRIINISSVAGKFASPFVGAYVGSKHAVEGLSQSLRRELLLYGVDVIVVGPGAVKTPIWDKGIKMEKYKETAYGRTLGRFAKAAKKGGEEGLTIEYLGESIVDIAEKRKPKVRYAFVPKAISNWHIPRLLPHRLIDRFIKKQLFS